MCTSGVSKFVHCTRPIPCLISIFLKSGHSHYPKYIAFGEMLGHGWEYGRLCAGKIWLVDGAKSLVSNIQHDWHDDHVHYDEEQLTSILASLPSPKTLIASSPSFSPSSSPRWSHTTWWWWCYDGAWNRIMSLKVSVDWPLRSSMELKIHHHIIRGVRILQRINCANLNSWCPSYIVVLVLILQYVVLQHWHEEGSRFLINLPCHVQK